MRMMNLIDLIDFHIKDLVFYSKVLIVGSWQYNEYVIEPGRCVEIRFFLEQTYKRDIQQIVKLDNLPLPENIVVKTSSDTITDYTRNNKLCSLPYDKCWILRDDFRESKYPFYPMRRYGVFYAVCALVTVILTELDLAGRVLIIGDWGAKANCVDGRKKLKVSFFLEQSVKKNIKQIEWVDGMVVRKNITLEVSVDTIHNFKSLLEKSEVKQVLSRQAVLRNDFKGLFYGLRRDQVVTLLNCLLCRLPLPRKCAVIVFNCPRDGQGIRCFGCLELLFVFERAEDAVIKKIMRLSRIRLLGNVRINPVFTDSNTYDRLLNTGFSSYYTTRMAPTAIVLYDYFRRRRLKAPFMY